MTVSREIQEQINWFNKQLIDIKEKIANWLKELGYDVEESEETIQLAEKLSGPYATHKYHFIINKDMEIDIKPYAIWIVGAKGRIDIAGPAGSEKLLYFLRGGDVVNISTQSEDGRIIDNKTHKYFNNIDEDNWYWYNDSSYRQVSKLDKEIIEPLLESIQ